MKKIIELKNNNIAPFRFKKLKNGKILLSNYLGMWVILNKENFIKFVSGKKLNKEIEEILKKRLYLFDEKETQKEFIKKWSGFRLIRNNHILSGPSLHIIVLTNSCNYNCIYCHASSKNIDKYHLNKSNAKKYVDIIFQSNSKNITIEFQGGEPLLNWEILKFIIEYANKKNKKYNKTLSFTLVSNLSLIDNNKIKYLAKYNVKISTSIDGNKLLNDKNRIYKKGSGFEKTLEGIKLINNYYKKNNLKNKISSIVTTTKNSLDKHKEIVDTYIDLGFNEIFIRQLNPLGYANKHWEKIGYTFDEFTNFYLKMLQYIKQRRDQGYDIIDVYAEKICNSNLHNLQKVKYSEEISPCGAILGQILYNRDGSIFTCDEGRMLAATGDFSFKIININDIDDTKGILKKIILSEISKIMVYSSLIDFIPGYDQDPISDFCGVCPIYSYIKNGNILNKYKKESKYFFKDSIIQHLLNNE